MPVLSTAWPPFVITDNARVNGHPHFMRSHFLVFLFPWFFPQLHCKKPLTQPWSSVVSVANVSFEQTNLLSEQTERNHFMNWFIPFSVQLSSAASMPAGSLTAVTASQRSVRTWFRFALWFVHDSRTYCTQRTIAEDVILVHVLCWKWRCVTQPLTQGRGVDSRPVTVLLKLALCC